MEEGVLSVCASRLAVRVKSGYGCQRPTMWKNMLAEVEIIIHSRTPTSYNRESFQQDTLRNYSIYVIFQGSNGLSVREKEIEAESQQKV